MALFAAAAFLSSYTGPDLVSKKSVLAFLLAVALGAAALVSGQVSMSRHDTNRLAVVGTIAVGAALPLTVILDIAVLGTLNSLGIYW